MSDPVNPYTLSESIRAMGRHLQEDMRQVMEAETDAVAGIVGNQQVRIIEWLDVIEKQLLLITERLDAIEAQHAREVGEAARPVAGAI